MQNSGFCQKGDVCTFAHSLQELAPGPGPQTASPLTATSANWPLTALACGVWHLPKARRLNLRICKRSTYWPEKLLGIPAESLLCLCEALRDKELGAPVPTEPQLYREPEHELIDSGFPGRAK